MLDDTSPLEGYDYVETRANLMTKFDEQVDDRAGSFSGQRGAVRKILNSRYESKEGEDIDNE
jgi:hypothetical protein